MNFESTHRTLFLIDRLLASLRIEQTEHARHVREALISSLQRAVIVRCPVCRHPHRGLELEPGEAMQVPCEICDVIMDVECNDLADYQVQRPCPPAPLREASSRL